MFKSVKTNINVVKLLTVIIIFLLIQYMMYKYAKWNVDNNHINNNMMLTETKEETTLAKDVDIWQIEIEKIELKAEISEGTTEEKLSKYVGHFEETQKENGNIGLAAHNRGEVNYFQELKKLQEGDEIKYQYNKYQNTYEVIRNIIIKDTDWEYLEETEENQLTLITCVENEPELRRCVQAVEKEVE